jgi:hypothetical protein
VLGPPVETSAPVVVFTGPANNPDKSQQTASATPKKKKKVAKQTTGDQPAKTANPAKPAKPKVSSAGK